MLSLKQAVLAALIAASIAGAQPALTTIQDTLYRADGSRFTGTVYINWVSFQGGDTSNIATSSLTIPIVNGAFRVRLVPTTTASAGAHYDVRYNSRGINDSTETWAVPPSALTLRIRDVRVSNGTVIGPPPVTGGAVQIPDVAGLANELALRISRGIGFGIDRAAVINQAGQIDAAAGSLGDCLHVDGSSGPCGSGSGGGGSFADAETPNGAINGVNTLFTLAHLPAPANSLQLLRNGVQLIQGVDYTLSGSSITFFLGSLPVTGDLIRAAYRFGNVNTGGTVEAAQVICSSTGFATSLTSSQSLGTCSIPSNTLVGGDRLELQFQYTHSGVSSGFTAVVNVGGVNVLTRAGGTGDPILTGRISYAIGSANQSWSTQSWGSSLGALFGAGTANQSLAGTVLVDFRGALSSATSDALTMSNFTVIRYPAVSNP